MEQDNGRVLTDQALVSDQAASRLAPSGFDPSRGEAILAAKEALQAYMTAYIAGTGTVYVVDKVRSALEKLDAMP